MVSANQPGVSAGRGRYLNAGLLAEAAKLAPENRYPWLRDRGLLDTFYLIL